MGLIDLVQTLICRIVALIVIIVIIAFVYLHTSYIPVRDGKLYLGRANSTVTLLREGATGFHHIEADSIEMAAYTQGFAHA